MQMKEVRDPVHGFIYFNETEMKIVNTRVFQRLRYIRQLAFTHLVYPGAEHSRFAHSMGVMEFATKMFDTLMMKNLAKKMKWSNARVKRNRQLGVEPERMTKVFRRWTGWLNERPETRDYLARPRGSRAEKAPRFEGK